MNRINGALIALALVLGVVAAPQSEAAPDARSIYVNGKRMGPAESPSSTTSTATKSCRVVATG